MASPTTSDVRIRTTRVMNTEYRPDKPAPRVAESQPYRHGDGLVTLTVTEDEFLVLQDMAEVYDGAEEGTLNEVQCAVLHKLGVRTCGAHNRYTPDPLGNPVDMRFWPIVLDIHRFPYPSEG